MHKFTQLHAFTLTLALLAITSVKAQQTIPLPDEFADIEATIVFGERWTYWEKSLVLNLASSRRVLSTNEGFVAASAVVNHSAHPQLWNQAFMELGTDTVSGGDVYLEQVETQLAERLALPTAEIALTGTAADMANLAVVTTRFDPFVVTALVTAGARTNAHRAGTDSGSSIEATDDIPAGTVNIVLLSNTRFTDGGQANALIITTEAKTAAFQDLGVQSSYSAGHAATGTGTDSIILIPSSNGRLVSYAGGHSKIGELIAKAVHQAVIEALIKQNGYSLN